MRFLVSVFVLSFKGSSFKVPRLDFGPEAPFWGVVRFWTPFSEKMLQNHRFLHGLGAGEGAEADEPDEADEADYPEMVHSREFRP